MIQYLEGQTEFTYEDLKEYAQLLESQLLNGVSLEISLLPTFIRETFIYSPEKNHTYLGELPQGYKPQENPIYIHAYDDIIEKGYIDIKVVIVCRGKYSELINHVIYESRVNKNDVYNNMVYGKIKVYEVTETVVYSDCSDDICHITTKSKARAMCMLEELKEDYLKKKQLTERDELEEENLLIYIYKDYDGLGGNVTLSCKDIYC